MSTPLAFCSIQAERLVSKFEELGAVTGDLGLSAVALAKFEDTDGTQCGAYTDSAMASRTISADAKRVGMVSDSRTCRTTFAYGLSMHVLGSWDLVAFIDCVGTCLIKSTSRRMLRPAEPCLQSILA